MHHLAPPFAAFGLGAALGLLPGPVQLVLLTESSRGGLRRGLSAMAGANGTFGVLLLALAGGLALLVPGAALLRVLEGAGGAFLLWLAWDAIQSARRPVSEREGAVARRNPLPVLRGVLAVLLNPGAWIFLATTASAVLEEGARAGGRTFALLTALAMLVGVVLVDGSVVLIGASGRRLGAAVIRVASPILGLGLAAFGGLLLFRALAA